MRLGLWRFSVAVIVLGGAFGAGCKDKSVELTLFHTNDVHSHFRAERSDPFGLGGLARLSTLLTARRQAAPRSLTLDGGDFSEGTWHFSIDAGLNTLKIMGAMRYDAAAVGNHDFLTGPQVVQDVASQSPIPILAANLDPAAWNDPTGFRTAVPESVIREVGGIKVGIIGLTTFELLYDAYLRPVKIINPIDTATRVAKTLRPQVDVLLIVSHNAFDTNVELARAVPGVDAVISGHSHRKLPKAVVVQNAGRGVPVVETGEWAKFLGELTLLVDVERKWVRLKNYQLHAVTPDIPEDPEIASMVLEQDRILNDKFHDDIHRVIAHADMDLVQQDSQESPLGNLAVKAYRAATGAEVAMEEISLTGVSIAKGGATLYELHNVVPHIYDPATGKEWFLRVWNARGSDLSLAINVFYTISGLLPLGSPLGWLSIDGAEVVWDPKGREGSGRTGWNKVKSVTIGGEELDPGKRYRVALSDGLLFALTLANDKFGLGVDFSEMENSGVEAWQAVVDYATSVRELKKSDLRIGSYVHLPGSDAAIYYYGLDWDGTSLSAEVENQGLSRLEAGGALRCYSGVANDFIAYGTGEQKWTLIGEAAVPALEAGRSTVLQIPWDQTKLPAGYLPVQCHLSSDGDRYETNNGASRVFRN